jgi:hypothetical protein
MALHRIFDVQIVSYGIQRDLLKSLSMIPKSCRLFGQDHAAEQILRAGAAAHLGLGQLPQRLP